MQPGSVKPLTSSEVKEAFEHAPYRTKRYVEWRDAKGREHRDDDLPSTVWGNGGQDWSQHGKYHRPNGLPAIIYSNGRMTWWEHGECIGDQDTPPENAPEIFLFQPGQQTKSASKK